MDTTQIAALTAKQVVKEAGRLLMDNFEHVSSMSFKGKSDIVTELDLKSNDLIKNKLALNFPDHSVLSEETGLENHDSKYTWIIDPIDGTINYYFGSHPFRVGVCLLEDKLPLVTAIYSPSRDVLYFAQKGKGATANDQPIHVNDNADLTKSIVMTHLSSKHDARVKTIAALDRIFSQAMHMRMYGSGLAALCYIATGKFDVFFNALTHPWDILPGALLVEEAGGTVTDIHGDKITHQSTSILATNGHVHAEMLELLKDL